MSVKMYQANGESLWLAYVNLRHPNLPGVRKQKMVKGFKSKAAALQEEKKLIKTLSHEMIAVADLGPTWEELVDGWEVAIRADPNRQIAQTTFADHLSVLRRWTHELYPLRAKEIGKAELRRILKRSEDEGLSRSFQVSLRSAINGVFRWAIEEDKVKGLTVIPTEGLHVKKRIEEQAPEILSLDEIKTLLGEARKLEHPWYPVWAVALLTGMRAGELHALRWTDVDLTKDMIVVSRSYNPRFRVVSTTKAGYWRNVPVASDLKELLLKLRQANTSADNVLPRFNSWDKGEQARILRTFCKGIGLRSVRFHTLRACFATQLLSNGVAPARVMKICGWRDLATMERYIRLAGVDERGATDSLKLIETDAKAVAEVVDFFKFKAER